MIKFLDKKTILAFQQDKVKIFGAIQAVRDEDLLESSILRRKQENGIGRHLYLSLCNWLSPTTDKKSLYVVMIDLANGKREKKELVGFLEGNT